MVAITAQSSKSRLNFPFKEPEQWWEIWHNTERSLAAQFAMIPVSAVAMQLLEEPAIKNAEKGGLYVKAQKSFLYAMYEYLENVFLRTTGAQTIRSWTNLYSKDQKFQHCMEAGELLSGLAASAAHHDNEPLSLVEELKNGHATPVHDFIFHSKDANKLFSDFITGEMEATPSNLRQLEQHLQALSELSSQPLTIAQEMRKSSTEPVGPHTRPSDYIREVLQSKQLQNPRQLQILFSLIPPLITHGALALSHVEYVPQDKRFLTVEQSVKLAKSVETMMTSHAYEYNHDKDGKQLIAGVSANAIIKKSNNGYEVLSQKELLQFGNRLLHQTKEIAGQNINRILSYADEHYEAVEQQLLKSVYPDTPKKPELQSTTALESLPTPEVAKEWNSNTTKAPHSHVTNRWKSSIGAALEYQKRPEAGHEKKKLYKRKLPNDAAKVLVNVGKDVLKLTNANTDIMWKALKGEKFDNPYYNKGLAKEKKQTNYNWSNHLKKETWGIAMKPLAGSYGLVTVKEIASTSKKLTGDSIKGLSQHLSAAIAQGKTLDASVSNSLEEVNSALSQKSLSISPALKAKVEHIQKKDPSSYDQADFALLKEYFATLSTQVNQQSEKMLAPYQKGSEESLQHIIGRNILQPVDDMPSALTTLSFVQSVLEKEKKNIDSLEFVDPKKNLIPLKSFRKIGDYMENQLTAAGIAIVGQKYQNKVCSPQGFTKGAMVEYNQDTKKYESIKPETIIRLANVVSRKFRNEIGDNTQRIANGTIDRSHYAFVEKSLFSSQDKPKKAATEKIFSGEKRWSTSQTHKQSRGFVQVMQERLKHAFRSEALHEAKMLWSRTTFNRFTGIPVSLWQNIRKEYIPFKEGSPKVKQNASLKNIWDNPKGFISKGSLLSELWGAVAYPIAEFISVIGREMSRYKVVDTIDNAAHASDSLSELLHKAPTLSADWEKEYLSHTGKSAALEQMAEEESFKMIPRIAMKPEHLRLDYENLLMNHYMQKAGAVTLATASNLMNKDGVKNSKNPLELPVENLVNAHEALATIKTVMDASRQHLGVLRYVAPEKIILDAKALAQLSETIDGQYKSAERSRDLNSEKGFIRLSNVIRDEFLAMVDMDKYQSYSANQNKTAVSR